MKKKHARVAEQPIEAEIIAPPVDPGLPPAPRQAATRNGKQQLSGHYDRDVVKAFRMLAVTRDVDVQELLAEAINMVFERYGDLQRINITSGRRNRINGP